MTIAAVLRAKGDEVVHVSPETTLRAFVALLAERRIGAAPVIEGGRIVGIMSERDVIHALCRADEAILDSPVSQAMTVPPITVSSAMPLLEALSLMTRRRIRHLPVVEDDGRMIGFVSIGDLVKARIDSVEQEAAAMRHYIAS